MDQLIRWGRDAFLLAGLAIVPAAAIWAVLTWWRSRDAPRSAAARSAGLDVALFMSLALIAVVGLRPGLGLSDGWDQWTFVPFRDLLASLDGPGWGVQIAVANLVGNAALFAPWGVVFALRFRRTSSLRFLVLTVAISITVEIGQAISATGRLSDVTDVLMNTTGGLLGFEIGRMFLGQRIGSTPDHPREP